MHQRCPTPAKSEETARYDEEDEGEMDDEDEIGEGAIGHFACSLEKAGHYLRQSLPQGEPIEVGGERGEVEQVGPVSTVFRDGERSWSIPNTRLLDEVIRR